jgi:hypothetical protein
MYYSQIPVASLLALTMPQAIGEPNDRKLHKVTPPIPVWVVIIFYTS